MRRTWQGGKTTKLGPISSQTGIRKLLTHMGKSETYVQIEIEDDEAVNVTLWWPDNSVDLQGYYGNWTDGKD